MKVVFVDCKVTVARRSGLWRSPSGPQTRSWEDSDGKLRCNPLVVTISISRPVIILHVLRLSTCSDQHLQAFFRGYACMSGSSIYSFLWRDKLPSNNLAELMNNTRYMHATAAISTSLSSMRDVGNPTLSTGTAQPGKPGDGLYKQTHFYSPPQRSTSTLEHDRREQ